MDVSAESDWVAAKYADLAVGDLFVGRSDGADVLALVAEGSSERFALVLGHTRKDGDVGRSPPPAGWALNGLGDRFLKFTGKAEAKPALRSAPPGAPCFPGMRSEANHGDLVIDPAGVPWIFVRDRVGPEPNQVLRFFVNLKTGELATPGGGAVHEAWELHAVRGDGARSVLARFGG